MAERTGVAARRRDIARRFRQNPTPAERKLWNLLRSKRDAGWKFRRQQPIGPFLLISSVWPQNWLSNWMAGNMANRNASDAMMQDRAGSKSTDIVCCDFGISKF